MNNYEKQGNKAVYCQQNLQDKYQQGHIVLEEFNGGNGFYKLHLDHLNKKQVEKIESLVSKWKSTDEIIKDCIEMCLTDANKQRFKDYGISLKDCLDWLGRQGDKPLNDTDEDIVEAVKNISTLDLVGPKFHESDWVVHIATGIVHQIKSLIENVTNKTYGYDLIDGGYISSDDEVNYRLWTIQDAKDGDVLAFKNNIGGIIICKSPSYYDTSSYCRLVNGHLINKEENGWDSTMLVPATKEQRNFLFQKMKETEYEWNVERKELNKIHVIDEGKAEMDYCFTKMMNGGKMNLCSEDDEIEFNHILKILTSVAKEQEIKGYNNLISSINWLKSMNNSQKEKAN